MTLLKKLHQIVVHKLFPEIHWIQWVYPLNWIQWQLRYRKSAISGKRFSTAASSYAYFVHPYNHTWKTERAVEIPIVLEYLNQFEPQETLEVGNVLSHYVDVKHTIVDKFEKGRGIAVINEDILDYCFDRTFSLIVSISTIEHIGWDGKRREPELILEALKKLQSLLRAQGKAVITVPIGYNHYLDKIIREKRIPFSEVLFLTKKNVQNDWVQSDSETALQYQYNQPFQYANAIAVLILDRNNIIDFEK